MIAIILLSTSLNLNFYKFGKVCTIATRKFCSGRLESLILHIFDPNYSSFYLKCPRKYQETYTVSNLHLSPSQILEKILNLIITHPPSPICILLKFDSAKLVFPSYSFMKSYQRKTFGVGSTPPPPIGKGKDKKIHC